MCHQKFLPRDWLNLSSQTKPHKDVKESAKENNKVKAKDADGDDESEIDESTTLHVVTLEARMGQLEWPYVVGNPCWRV
jgi:hypothetical protein